jgi:hypothetical protein
MSISGNFGICAGLALGAVLGGCNAEQESISQVTKPRLLAVQAEPPEIPVGGETTLSLLLVDQAGPISQKAEIAWVVLSGDYTAVPDPSEFAVDLDQDALDLRMPLEVELGGSFLLVRAGQRPLDLADQGRDGKITAFALVCVGGVLPSTPKALFDRMADLFAGRLEDHNGVCDGPGAGIIALKQITVSRPEKPASDVNHNPQIHSLLLENRALLSDLGDKVQLEHVCEGADGCREELRLAAYLNVDGFETYPSALGKERLEEVVYVSWFTTGGKWNADRSGVRGPPEEKDSRWGPFEASWFPPRDGGTVDLWCVAHDVRGGVSWWRARLRVLANAPSS